MSFINKPKVAHPSLPTNALGLTRRQYEGTMSTLCAGCGHDSITAALIEACWGLDMRPEQLVKLSGIGCSSKTTSYFVSGAHGFNSVHGRMPSIASGANAANRELTYVGISGDGDSLSIGLGQLVHAIRRNVNMLYVIENNGVYGLTKGQFSASADIGTQAKKGEVNQTPPIDPVLLALSLGATFVARSFSGDKAQLVPLIQAGMRHNGFALIDVLSPCVTFNDHEGSTKSYTFTREHYHAAMEADFVPPAERDCRRLSARRIDTGATARRQPRRTAQTRRRATTRPIAARPIASSKSKLKQNEYVTGLIHINETGSTRVSHAQQVERRAAESHPVREARPGQRRARKI